MSRIALPVFLLVSVMAGILLGQQHHIADPNHDLDSQGLAASMIVNQLAILKVLNETSSFCSSGREEGLDASIPDERSLAGQTLDVVKKLQGERDELFTKLVQLTNLTSHGLQVLQEVREEVKSDLQEVREEVKSDLQEVREEVKNDLQEVREALLAAGDSIPDWGRGTNETDPFSKYAVHNDTNPSYCADQKVLFGTRGSLEATRNQAYSPLSNCGWHVTLPEGTHAVFTWEYLNIEACSSCGCDSVTVTDFATGRVKEHCGTLSDFTTTGEPGLQTTTGGNIFTVEFQSDSSVQEKGFRLYYHAVPDV